MKINKKAIALSVLALMLVATGYINYTKDNKNDLLTNTNSGDKYIPIGEAKSVSATEKGDGGSEYFKKARIDKETRRADAIELLNETVNNTMSTPESKAKAEEKLSEIASNIEKECAAENLIKAKGYSDAIVYIGDSSVNVIVCAKELTTTDTTKIRDIIYEQTNNNNIKIVAVE